MSKTSKIIFAMIVVAILIVGVGYAAIQNITLNISGTATADPTQANFKVMFSGTPTVSDDTLVTSAITDDTNATINVEGLTKKGDVVTATYVVQNASTDLSADLSVSTTNSNSEYFTLSSDIEKTSLVAGEATTVTVKVELTKTPITESVNATIGVQLTAIPVQPGEEGSSGLTNDYSQTPGIETLDSWQTIINSNNTNTGESEELTLAEFQAVFAGGTGIESDPYQIKTAEQLAYLAKYTNDKTPYVTGSYFELMNDINLEYREWTSIGIGNADVPERSTTYTNKLSETAFTGYFDGNDHKITRLYINKPDICSLGVFGTLDGNAVVQNLIVESGSVTGKYHVGGIAGISLNGTIKNCTNKAAITAQDNTEGASGENAGGIVGTMTIGTSLIENCTNYGNITTKNDSKSETLVGKGAGGIVGYAEHYSSVDGVYTIRNCINYGEINCSYQQTGGIIGYIDSGTIENCINNGKVKCFSKVETKNTSGTYVGGIAGVLSDAATINNCKNNGELIADLGKIGGICARNLSGCTISNSENTGTIRQLNKILFTGAIYEIGGICGWNQGTLEYNYNTGIIESNTDLGNTEYAGGITGRNAGLVQYCYNSGNITNSNHLGGVIGRAESGTLTKNYYYVESITKGIGTSADAMNGTDIVDQAEKITAEEAELILNFASFKTWIATK